MTENNDINYEALTSTAVINDITSNELNRQIALANTIKIEDITSNELNRQILYRLNSNDPSFDKLYIFKDGCTVLVPDDDDNNFILFKGEDIGWLGYFIGQNTKLQELYYCTTIDDESFYNGLCLNKSIEKVDFGDLNLSDGKMFFMMDIFFKNNHNLTSITVKECTLRFEGAHRLSLAIGSFNNNSLKHIEFSDITIDDDESAINIIIPLNVHPQLEELELTWMGIGRKECLILATLLRCPTQLKILDRGNRCKALSTQLHCTATQLRSLDLTGNNIDDESIKVLVHGISNGINNLQELNLSTNLSITIKGWKEVATLLETPGSKLKALNVQDNGIRDEEALLFANALTNNSTLEELDLSYNNITAEGWAPFLRLLCDTSSINNTYLSNHALQSIGGGFNTIPKGIFTSLDNNTSDDKQQVAITKILQNHSHFNRTLL